MNYAKVLSKTSFVILSAVVCTTLVATDASAQRRGGGQNRGGGGRSAGQGRAEGRAVPRGSVRGGGVRGISPRIVSPRVIVRAPYRSYYSRPYFRSGFSLGLFAGYPYYGYPYRYYGSPYGYYGNYGYPGYAYRGYGYPPAGGYDYGPGGAYGGVRIEGAPQDAQVFVDGYYAGIVDDFDGLFQHLNLEPGPHSIEIRLPGGPPIEFDVNVQPGRTVTFHAGIR